MFPKLSVALTTNIYVVFWETSSGTPDITPLELNDSPGDNAPLRIAYEIDTAGDCGIATNVIETDSVDGKDPKVPAGVVQVGWAILSL